MRHGKVLKTGIRQLATPHLPGGLTVDEPGHTVLKMLDFEYLRSGRVTAGSMNEFMQKAQDHDRSPYRVIQGFRQLVGLGLVELDWTLFTPTDRLLARYV